MLQFSLQVIVHTAIRTKVPFKKKVRGKRSSKSKGATKTKEAKKKSTSSGLFQAAVVATASTNHDFKRTGNSTENQLKLKKNKNRLAPGTTTEEKSIKPQTDPLASRAKKSTQYKSKASAKHKEIIDYSKRTRTNDSQSKAIGKVHQWLLESPTVNQQPASKEVEHVVKAKQIMSKSHSTPERIGQRPPKKIKSANNVNDKVKLQVVYKPPFKFSLKLSKNSAVKTKVIEAGDLARSKRKSAKDKDQKRQSMGTKGRRKALLIRSKATDDHDRLSFNLKSNNNINEDQQQLVPFEPNYETLETKKESPTYENLKTAHTNNDTNIMPKTTANKLNTDTFRISKSCSSNNIIAQSCKLLGKTSGSSNSDKANNNSDSAISVSHVGTENAVNGRELDSINHKYNKNEGSTTNLSKRFPSSQNLSRSSTTNLSKTSSTRKSFDTTCRFDDIGRSSTSNLSKNHRHGSHLNLSRNPHLYHSNSNISNLEDILLPSATQSTSSTNNSNRARRNSSTVRTSDSKTSIPRVLSNSNLKTSSQRRVSVNNIPRASLNINLAKQTKLNPAPQQFMRQSSLQPHTTKKTSNTSHISNDQFPLRPHTSECASDKKFEWPTSQCSEKAISKEEPSLSTEEVAVSDIENLVIENNK